MNENNGCTCCSCKQACEYKPGWFMPGEAEKAAEFLGLSLQEFFTSKLGVDWWVDDVDIFLLAPATTTTTPGQEYPGNPRGQCTFYEETGLCAIHKVKPFECREYSHDDTGDDVHSRHESVAMAWKSEQAQIRELLGRYPRSESFGFFGFF